MVPLTTSLYIPGKLADTEKVLVDVGTGYYVEKSTTDAEKFYQSKVDGLGKSLADLEKVIAQKSQNLRIVEDGKLQSKPFLNRCLTTNQSCGRRSWPNKVLLRHNSWKPRDKVSLSTALGQLKDPSAYSRRSSPRAPVQMLRVILYSLAVGSWSQRTGWDCPGM